MKGRRLSKLQKALLNALSQNGNKGSTRTLAIIVDANVNGSSQALGALASRGLVQLVGGKGGETQWRLAPDGVELLDANRRRMIEMS